MFRKLTLTTLCVAAVLAVSAESAKATFIGSILTNGPNTFADQDVDAFIDVDSDGFFSVGDVLVAIVRLDDQTSAGGIGSLGTRTFTITSQQVSSIDAQGGTTTRVNFGPTTAAGLTLSELTGGAASQAGGMTAVYSGAPITDLINTSPGDLTGSPTVNLFDYLEEITSNQELTIVSGFGAAPTEADDFFFADIGNAFIGLGTASIPVTPDSVDIGTFRAGQSVLFNADSFTFPLVTYNEAVLSAATGSFTVHQVVIGSGNIRGGSNATNVSEWGFITGDNPNNYASPGGFSTDADFFVDTTVVVPEPGSVVLFGMGSLMFLGVGLRRRRRNAEA